MPGRAVGVAVSGSYAYVADGDSGLQVVDITTPETPLMVSSVYTPGGAGKVSVSGSYAYVADGHSGLQVLPLQCGSGTPLFLTSFVLSRSDEAVEARWAVRAGQVGGEFRLDASRGEERWDVRVEAQPGPDFFAFDRSPLLADGGHILYRLFHRDLWDSWIVLAEQRIMLGIPPGTTKLVGLYPNPAKTRVVLPFSSGRGGKVRLTVHDVAGRLVACVFEGSLRPGTGQWIWSLEDGRGAKLAAGVYLVRLTTEQGVQTRKVVLLE